MELLEGGDISIEHFLQDQKDLSNSSSLQEVFQGSTVLLSGVTGPLGSLVLERFLRLSSQVTKVYVMVRGKNGKSAQQRLKELFSNKVFDRVRLEYSDSFNKVELLDLDLGLQTHIDTLALSVTIVIHCALVTDVEHSLKEAVDANIKFTKTLLQLAYSCKKLEAFIVASSTLGHNREPVVEERFYPPPVTAKAMCIICDTLSEDVFNFNTTGLFVSNTSASSLTLSIMEDLIRQGKKYLPLAIVRPSMLVASYKDPLAGWLPETPRGIMRLLTLSMQGRLCSLRIDTALKAELMPTDLAASMLLAVTAHTALTRRNFHNMEIEDTANHGQVRVDSDIPIYNLVSSNHSPLTWGEFFTYGLRHARKVPSLDMAWYPHLFMTTSSLWFSMWFYILHILPAKAIDTFHAFSGDSEIVSIDRSGVYKKYQSLGELCELFTIHTMTSQKYRDNNTQALLRSLSPSDKTTFNFDISQLDWNEYLYTLTRGIRLYCLGDSLDTVPRAINRMKRLKILHYSFAVMFSFIILMFFLALVMLY